MTYKQSCTKPPSQQTLGLHKNSHTITKIQPKIRIIHIYAPEIIETDVANFRELVQRLTGKPPPVENRPLDKGKGKGKPKKKQMNRDPYPLFEDNNMPTRATITGSSSSPSSSCDHLHHDDDQSFWRTTSVDPTNNTSGGFLSEFTDMDDHFDLMFTMGAPDSSSHHLHSFGDSAQLSFRG